MSVVIKNVNGDQNIYYEFDPDLKNVLGEGGMGRVFRGKQVEGKGTYKKEREVAIKLLFEELPQSAIDRSRREASIRIKNDNVVEMIDFVEVKETSTTGQIVASHYHVVSELLEGLNLDELLAGRAVNHDGKPNPTADHLFNEYKENRKAFVGTVFRKILSGVQALHDRGYIHRDIDPSNIMVTSDGKIKLIDFGIARQVNDIGSQDRHLTKTGQFVGKPYYASPELITGDIAHQNYSTDIYSLGVMLFQLVVGHLPFDGPSHEVAEKHVKEKMPLHEVKDKTIRRIIEKATEKKQQNRYQSAAEFRVDIDKWLKESPHPPFPWKKTCLGLAGLAVVATAAYFILTYEPKPPIQVLAEENDTAKIYLRILGSDTTQIVEMKEVEKPIKETKATIDEISYAKARALLLDTDKALEGFSMLEQLVELGDIDAAFLKSRLYFDPIAAKNKGTECYQLEWGEMRTNCDITANNGVAHALLMDAYHLNRDTHNYQLLYELGCDFLYSADRFGDNSNLTEKWENARWCFEKVKEYGKNDALYNKEVVEDRLNATVNKTPIQPK